MNSKQYNFLIRLTNKIALYTIIALIYWIFIFLLINIFDFRIFRERMTEAFIMSILGIFTILGATIILNIMSNLSKISDAISSQTEVVTIASYSRIKLLIIVLSFPTIALFLYAGNQLSDSKKKNLLIKAAEKLVAENKEELSYLANYKFSSDYIKEARNKLKIMEKIDIHLPQIEIIVPEKINNKQVFLAFSANDYYNSSKTEQPEISSYIFSTSKEDREYLTEIFGSNSTKSKFISKKENYTLFFPTELAGKKIIIFFSDYQRYGKLGSS